MLKFKKIKKQDTVEVITGKEKGKQGKVIEVNREKGGVLIEGVNLVRKTMRKTKVNPLGGIKDVEAFLDISNVCLSVQSVGKRQELVLK